MQEMPLLWSESLTKHLLLDNNKDTWRTLYTQTLKTTSEPADRIQLQFFIVFVATGTGYISVTGGQKVEF
jgi:hypothetical protein